MTDWRYLVTYEGIVSIPDSGLEVTTAADEQAAINAALADVDNGKIPAIEVEEIGE